MIELPQGGEVRVIAGTFALDGRAIDGPVNGTGAKLTTDPSYLDVRSTGRRAVHGSHAVGPQRLSVHLRGERRDRRGGTRRKRCRIAPPACCPTAIACRSRAGEQGVRFLLLAAKPLREPVVQYGPFVMNTREEIEQALADYRDGRLATAA